VVQIIGFSNAKKGNAKASGKHNSITILVV
jgi:hypothetical protein